MIKIPKQTNHRLVFHQMVAELLVESQNYNSLNYSLFCELYPDSVSD